MTEKELVERCRRGDREAQQQLYLRTSPRIYRLLLRMTHNPDDALDLAQTTFLRAFENIAHFDGKSRLTTWIYRIAINEGLQLLRQQKRREVQYAVVAEQTEVTCDDRRERTQDDVQEALALMPADERMLILLRYFEGLSYAEIAQILDKPTGTIASQLNRARERLRQRLGPAAGTGILKETPPPEHLT